MKGFFKTSGAVFKQTARTIRTFLGRYLALTLIVALSAGFFAGLKICTDAMVNTGDVYLDEQDFYDYRLLSTVGFDKGDERELLALDSVEAVEGTNTLDAMVTLEDGDKPLKIYAMTERVNRVNLLSGRLPEGSGECVVDGEKFDEDDIGTRLTVSEENNADTLAALGRREYEIVGLIDSPMYLGIDRGTTGIGSGSIFSFMYIPCEDFATDYYTEICLTLNEREYIYSEEYESLIKEHKAEITAVAERISKSRRDRIFEEMRAQLGALGINITLEFAEANGLPKLESYVLTRDENAGYASFENDTQIIGGVANIFPVFFILIALLVCITTMSRMVDEERTQIGVLKAMGYSDGAVMAKYLLYAASATVIGWTLGFFLCTWALPQIFWAAYAVLYGFAPMPYLFSPTLALITLFVSLAAILGATYLSCRKELSSKPADLIRPRAVASGKRVLLERVGFVWKRLSFIQKIIMRNMFRYKRRFIMMLVGISCCSGLLVTAFGVRDSMVNIAGEQYEKIQKYSLEVTFEDGRESAVKEKIESTAGVESYISAYSTRVDISSSDSMNSVNLLAFRDTGAVSEFWSYNGEEGELTVPEEDEVLINKKISDELSLKVGDEMEIRTSDMKTLKVKVGGIFENFIYNYVVMSDKTFEEGFGAWRANALLVKTADTAADAVERVAESITEVDGVSTVSNISAVKQTVTSALDVLNYIIWLVVFFSATLAFIVIFNLTNINIAERSREIATVEVLGFYPKETYSYVLRENIILSVISGLVGMPLGIFFHSTVMSMVIIDMFTFDIKIEPLSFVLGMVMTVIFAFIVNLFMRRQIRKIHMAESLKAVE